MLSLRVGSSLRDSRRETRVYSIAGRRLITDLLCDPLATFELSGVPAALAPEEPAAVSPDGRITFDGDGRIGGGFRRVTCREAGDGYRLQVGGVGVFAVTADGEIRGGPLAPDLAPAALAEAALGPALILALALQRVFCLHAGAVAAGDRAVAFLGPSGAGKSTLAARLPELGRGWRRVADDVLPVAASPGAPCALPYFPQLKLARHEQAADPRDARLELAAVYLLAPPAPAADEVAIRPLTGWAATVALARHTVAARLFGPALLAAHLAFCAEAAARVPIRTLAVPRRPDALPRVAAALEGAFHPLADR